MLLLGVLIAAFLLECYPEKVEDQDEEPSSTPPMGQMIMVTWLMGMPSAKKWFVEENKPIMLLNMGVRMI